MKRLNWDWLLYLMGVVLVLVTLFAMSRIARAGVSCSVPFNLTNGTLADASQVMANYNAILSCLANNTAESGANSSITSLSGLTTPISPAQGGTSVFVGTTSGGTNTITVGFTTPNSFSLTVGNKVIFAAGGANTTAATLAVGSTTVKNLYRRTPNGVVAMVGGEIVAGQIVEAVYDGTQYQMTSTPALGHAPGEVFDFAGTSCPVGSLATTGSTLVSQAAYPTLFSVLGTTWGAAGGGNFTVPDLRGRATFSADSGGSGRITVAGGNFDGTAVGNTGGQQNQTLSIAQLPVITPAGTISMSPGTNGSIVTANGASSVQTANSGGFVSYGGTASFTGTPFGSGNAHPVLSNAAIVLKCVKA